MEETSVTLQRFLTQLVKGEELPAGTNTPSMISKPRWELVSNSGAGLGIPSC